jgi:hypothetical protein
MSNFKVDDGSFTVESKPIVIKRKQLNLVGIGILPYEMKFDLTNIPENKRSEFLSVIETM